MLVHASPVDTMKSTIVSNRFEFFPIFCYNFVYGVYESIQWKITHIPFQFADIVREKNRKQTTERTRAK